MSLTTPNTGQGGFGYVPPPGGPPGSFIPDYPQSPLLQEIAQAAAALGQNVFNWGQNVYNQVGQVTAGNIAQYLDAANQAGGLASSAIQTFQNVANPTYEQLAAEAKQYAGTPFIQSQMGQAEATANQGATSNRQNLIQQMQSYGINPSSGMYQGLEEAALTGAGASEAAAGTEAALATKAQGQQLLTNATAAGAQYPGFAVNALNAREQGLAGAENSILGQANTGVNLMDAANPYLATAMSLKYPPLGNVPVTGGHLNTNPAPQQGSGNRANQSGNQNSPYPYDTSGSMRGAGPSSINSGPSQTVSAPRGGGGPGSTAQIQGAGDYSLDPLASGIGTTDPFATGSDQFGYGSGIGTTDPFATGSDQFGYGSGIGTTDLSGQLGQLAQDTSQLQQDASQAPAAWNPPAPDTTGIPTDTSGQSADWTPPTDSVPWGGDAAPPDSGSGGGDGGAQGGSAGYDFARGGIPTDTTSGGFVSQHASPSGGKNVDDVPAHLNAEEFVMPRDVARWKGEEFFHKLIAQSRRARSEAAATVGPTMHPAVQRQGTLNTRPGMNMR
jgi:hypothetical protein